MKLSNILKVLDRVVNIKLNNNRNIDKKHTLPDSGSPYDEKNPEETFLMVWD